MTLTWAAFFVLSVLGAATFFVAGLVLAKQRATVLHGALPLFANDALETPSVEIAPRADVALGPTRVLRAPPPAPPPRREDSVAALVGAGSPEDLLRRLRADKDVSTAVVSDELGLLVAGGGDRAEELAALGGFLAGVGDRARQLGGLGTPTRVVIEDDRHTTLTAIHVPGAPLVAVTVRREVTPADSGARPAAARR